MTEELYVLPASFGQRRLWLAEQTRPDTSLYTMGTALRLRGALDVPALERALTEVVARHEVLRSVLRLTGAEVSQVVRAPEPVKITTVEVGGGLDAVVAEAGRLAAVPFDLGAGPLLRCHLLWVGDDDHLLQLVVHHSVLDGESTQVLLGELTTLYRAFVEGTEPELPELPLQYADYALWQQGRLDSGALEDQLAYWRGRLAGAEELRLPADHPRPAVPTFASATAPVRIPAAAIRRLRETVAAGVTTPMIALAAYAVVLARWSGQDDVVVAVPVGGRTEVELEPLIGFFVNTVAVRVDLAGDPSFEAVLRQVRDASLAAYAHAELPFEHLVDQVRPDRRAGVLPIAQTMLTVQPTAVSGGFAVPGVRAEPVPLPQDRLVFDVKLDVAEQDDALTGVLIGRTELFDPETIALAARSFTNVLRSAATAPGTAVSALPCPIAGRAGVTTVAEPAAPAAAGDGDGTPSTPAEHLLAGLWREVLELAEVGVDDEFYASGGNSLRAVRIVMQAREAGVELPMNVLLGEHTIRGLAAAIR
ncbi:condensation domain-containing protein [Amycolatopsis sp. NPDC049253]|uniref:condensation domain-containing protein n=1 Tax=Amycolatopsis sp. NPDC049253 TaxID=3155274 RepID=UPI003443EDC5